MAYPASGIESVFRNNINTVIIKFTKVSKFLIEKHKTNFLVFNLSGKKYDNTKFENRVYELEWQDYNLKTLFTICQGIHKFLGGIIIFYYRKY